MKSRLVLLFIAMSFYAISSAQNECSELRNDLEIRQELQDLANQAADDLMKCCSKWGGNSLKAEIYWDKGEDGVCQTRISKLTGKITIMMRASWTGSVSGASYWIKGRLVVDMNNQTRTWQKLSDSGGFSPGCGKDCIH
jgi:hypothetical protein